MNRDSLHRFAERAAAGRTDLFGVEFRIEGQRATFTAAINAVTTRRQLEAGGWNPDVSAIVRVSRAEIARAKLCFALGQVLIRGTSCTYRLAEIRDNPVSPELVLGLANDLSRA